MLRTQIYLTEQEKDSLHHLSRQLRKTQSELIREAIDTFCESHLQSSRLVIMKNARGLWKKRVDLPDFSKLRKEFNRMDKEN